MGFVTGMLVERIVKEINAKEYGTIHYTVQNYFDNLIFHYNIGYRL